MFAFYIDKNKILIKWSVQKPLRRGKREVTASRAEKSSVRFNVYEYRLGTG